MNWLGHFISNVRQRVPDPIMIAFIAIVSGICIGSLVELLKWLMRWLWDFVSAREGGEVFSARLLLWPLAGILLTSIFQRYVVRRNLSHGTEKVKRILDTKTGDYVLPAGDMLYPIIACCTTVGFGASAGSEGPAAYSGAAVGSNLGRLFHLSPKWMQLMVGIGAGAGISAIFKAPIGGALYTLEVLELPMTTLPVMALVLATVTSAATSYMISGYAFDMSLVDTMRFDPVMLGWVSVIGVLCGFYGLWYVWSKNLVRNFFNSMTDPWAKAIISGVGMSLTVFMIPCLWGEGWGVLNSIANGLYPVLFDKGVFASDHASGFSFYMMLGIVLLIKGALVAAANNGGGAAGEMVPALFAGGIAGYMAVTAINQIFGMDLPVWYLSLAGMGAMLANSTHAPLMSSFIVYECTNTAQYLPGYLLCTLISYFIMKVVNPKSTWASVQRDDLIDLYQKAPSNQNLRR